MRPSSSSSDTASARISRSVRSLKSLGILLLLCQRLGAELAAASGNRHFAQAFGADFRRGIGRLLAALDAGQQLVYRQHDEEVHRGADEQKGNELIDEIANGEFAAIDGKSNP